MSKEAMRIRGVNNVYGERTSGGAIGNVHTEGSLQELVINLTGELLNNTDLLEPVYIPAGATIRGVDVTVDEVFVLGGTSPVVEIGTATSEATNGVTLTEANLETVQYVDATAALAGTWNEARFAADTLVGISLEGTTPTATATAGIAKVVIKYII